MYKTIALLSLIMVGYSYSIAQVDRLSLPENLDEVTLENVGQIKELAQLNLAAIYDLDWSSEGTLAVAVDSGVQLYNQQADGSESAFLSLDEPAWSIAFVPNTPYLIAGQEIYDVSSLEKIAGLPSAIYAATDDGEIFVVDDSDNVGVFNLGTQELTSVFSIAPPSQCDLFCVVTKIIVSPNKQYLAFSSANPDVYSGIIDLTDERVISPIEVGMSGLSFSPIDTFLVSRVGEQGYLSRGIMFTDIETGEHIGELQGYGDYSSPIFNRDGSLLVASGLDDSAPNPDEAFSFVAFFDVADPLTSHTGDWDTAIHTEHFLNQIVDVPFSPDFRALAVGDSGGNLYILGVPHKE